MNFFKSLTSCFRDTGALSADLPLQARTPPAHSQSPQLVGDTFRLTDSQSTRKLDAIIKNKIIARSKNTTIQRLDDETAVQHDNKFIRKHDNKFIQLRDNIAFKQHENQTTKLHDNKSISQHGNDIINQNGTVAVEQHENKANEQPHKNSIDHNNNANNDNDIERNAKNNISREEVKAQIPPELRPYIFSYLDSEERFNVARSSSVLNEEAGEKSIIGINRGLEKYADPNLTLAQIMNFHEGLQWRIPHNEALTTPRQKRYQALTREHLDRILTNAYAFTHNAKSAFSPYHDEVKCNSHNKDLAWDNLPLIADESDNTHTESRVLRHLLTKKHDDKKTLQSPTPAINQLKAALTAQETSRPTLFHLLAYNCPRETWDALRDAAKALPNGEGLHALATLELGTTWRNEFTSKEISNLRMDVATAAAARGDKASGDALETLTVRSHHESDEVVANIHKAALGLADGFGAKALCALVRIYARGDRDATIFPELRRETRIAAAAQIDGAGAPILVNLLTTCADPTELLTLLHDARLAALLQPIDEGASTLCALYDKTKTIETAAENKEIRQIAFADPSGIGKYVMPMIEFDAKMAKQLKYALRVLQARA